MAAGSDQGAERRRSEISPELADGGATEIGKMESENTRACFPVSRQMQIAI